MSIYAIILPLRPPPAESHPQSVKSGHHGPELPLATTSCLWGKGETSWSPCFWSDLWFGHKFPLCLWAEFQGVTTSQGQKSSLHFRQGSLCNSTHAHSHPRHQKVPILLQMAVRASCCTDYGPIFGVARLDTFSWQTLGVRLLRGGGGPRSNVGGGNRNALCYLLLQNAWHGKRIKTVEGHHPTETIE